MNWYFQDANGQQVEFLEAHFAQLIQNGTIHQQTLVWRQDMPQWLPAVQVWPQAFGYQAAQAQAPVAPVAGPPAGQVAPAANVVSPAGQAVATAGAPAAAANQTPLDPNIPGKIWVPAILCLFTPIWAIGSSGVMMFTAAALGIASFAKCIMAGKKAEVEPKQRVKMGWNALAFSWALIFGLSFSQGFMKGFKEGYQGAQQAASDDRRQKNSQGNNKPKPANRQSQGQQAQRQPKAEESRPIFDTGFASNPSDEPKSKPETSSEAAPEPEPEPEPVSGLVRGGRLGEGLRSTEWIGGDGGGEFYQYHTGQLPLRGIEYQLGNWGGKPSPKNLLAVFEDDQAPRSNNHTRVMAPEGHAIGALAVLGKGSVFGMRPIFMPLLENGKVNPDQAQVGDWIGTAPPDFEFTVFHGNGAPLMGLSGRTGMALDALGVLFLESDFDGIATTQEKITVPLASSGDSGSNTGSMVSSPTGIHSIMDAGKVLRNSTEENEINEAAKFIAENANPQDIQKFGKALATLLRPHLKHEDNAMRLNVSRAFALVAGREDTQYLEEMVNTADKKHRNCIQPGLIALLRVNSLKARDIIEQNVRDGEFRGFVTKGIKEKEDPRLAELLVESRVPDVFILACEILEEIGTASSANKIQGQIGNLPTSDRGREARKKGQETMDLLKGR